VAERWKYRFQAENDERAECEAGGSVETERLARAVKTVLGLRLCEVEDSGIYML
jgi:hypothetical protein